jgi:hypothetical protein
MLKDLGITPVGLRDLRFVVAAFARADPGRLVAYERCGLG